MEDGWRIKNILVDGTIDTYSPIDYPQVYAQLQAEIARGDRYWFDEADNQRIIDANRQFERVGSIESMIAATFRPADDDAKPMSVNEIVSVLNESFPNFHLTKAVNAEVGRALRHLGYQSKKTKTCQVYYITKNQ